MQEPTSRNTLGCGGLAVGALATALQFGRSLDVRPTHKVNL